ncbi:hypothetical protein M422DRAFT_69187 [Sphaerobolus stellatus SS14]|uniref:DUF6534 domain-containing protein n=1 Tax=Sphaerobolus stellatus (strain SS14) TaxID=990650 RepID=A0A0C9VJF9_SPHS4|nr:hypothetical protein M422DRAFT_69187 [Sphaerobolus stellatus SS14]
MTTSSADVPPTATLILPALDNTFGALLIAAVIAGALWGISTVQAYWYFVTYPKDILSLKLLVTLMWVTDTVHQALITHIIYYYLITHYFDPLNLDYAVWSLTFQCIFEFIPCFCVQSFFLMRIWVLSRGKWAFVVPPAFLILSKLALSMVWTIKCSRLKSVTEGLAQEHSVAAAINGCAAAGDIILAVTMVILLHRSRTGMRQSDSILEKLTLYTVNTGVITSLASIVTLITAEVWKHAFIYAIFYFCTGRLYVNTILASLNARKALKSQGSVMEMSNSFRAKSGPHSSKTEVSYVSNAGFNEASEDTTKFGRKELVTEFAITHEDV